MTAFVGILVPLATLVWAASSFLITKRIEAKRPFLDYQLKLYKEATEAAVQLATSDDAQEISTARKRFYELYWGELALVEDRDVERAMVIFKRALEANGAGDHLQQSCLTLAHAFRSSLARSWKVKSWQYQYTAPSGTTAPSANPKPSGDAKESREPDGKSDQK